MAADIAGLVDDLAAERLVLDEILVGLDEDQWHRPTPADGWSVLDQVTHLAYFDDQTRLSIEDPDAFRTGRDARSDVGAFVDDIARSHRHMSGEAVRRWFRDADTTLRSAALVADPSVRVPWYGPDMNIASSVTARVMETWAHGQDIADAVGIDRPATERLRHVVFLGVRAFANSFRANDLPVPDVEVRVELCGPGGEVWNVGPEGSTDLVRGSAVDFCLLVTQRRHRADTQLRTEGAVADRWLDIAQAFAGPPGAGRAPTT